MQPLEQQDPASGTNLLKLNELGGIFMASTLILCTMAFMTTIVLMSLNKAGKLGSFSPWKILVPVWATVAIVSLPGLIHFGSGFFPKPAPSKAEAVTPAYKNDGGGTGTITSQDQAKKLVADFPELPPGSFKELVYHKTKSGDLDPCVKMKLVASGSTWVELEALGFNQDLSTYVTPASYSESTCGGPIKEWTE